MSELVAFSRPTDEPLRRIDPYRYSEFPRMVYGPRGKEKMVNSEEELRALGNLWSKSPRGITLTKDDEELVVYSAEAMKAALKDGYAELKNEQKKRAD
jgi:hypothetical protein